MSQFDGGNRPVGPMGNGGVLPALYNTVLPNAPGVEPAPLVESETQRAIRQGLDAAGYAASITSTLGNLNQQQLAEAERLRRQQEAALEKQQNAIAQADRGLASRQTATDLAEIERRISAGELAPTEGESIEDFANRVLGMDDAAAAEFSPEYTAQRLAIGQPAIARAVSQRREGVIEAARGQQQELILASASSASTPEDIEATAKALTENNPTMTPETAKAAAVSRALNYQAKAGTTESFEKVREVAAKTPGISADDIADAQLKYRQRTSAEEAVKVQASQDELAAGLIKAGDGETTYDFVRAEYRRRWEGKIGPEALKTGLDRIDNEQSSRRIQIGEEAKKQIRREWDTAIVNQTRQWMSGARENGGAATLPPRFEETITLPDGTTMDMSKTRAEATAEATDAEMGAIAKSQPPGKALAEQMSWLGANGTEYEGFSRVMNAGASVAVTELASTKPGEPPKIPVNLAGGYDLYKRMGSINPVLRDRHVDATAGRIYELAQIAETEITGGDQAAALVMAVKAEQRRSTPGFQETDVDVIREAAGSLKIDWGFDKAIGNNSDVYERITGIAKVYVDGLGMGPARAVELAAKRVQATTTVLNGYAINTAGRQVPENLPVVATDVAGEYVKGHAEEGVDSDDLTLIPGPTDHTWVLWNKGMERPVENWQTHGYFTDEQISGRSKDAQARKAAASAKPSGFGRSIWNALSTHRNDELSTFGDPN